MVEAQVPDRPGRPDQARLWAEGIGMLLASPAVAAGVIWWVLDDGGAHGPEGKLLVTTVLLVMVMAGSGVSWMRSARTLASAPGRYAFVVDERTFSRRAGWIGTTTGHWIELAELDGRPIGWAQVGSSCWPHLEGEHVVAVWGEPGQVRHLVLSGAFPVTRVLGPVTMDEPTPP